MSAMKSHGRTAISNHFPSRLAYSLVRRKRRTSATRVTLIAVALSLGVPGGPLRAQDQQRAWTEREWTVKAEKMRAHLLPTMRAHGVDLWIILSRENSPDPALELFGGNGITGWYGARNAYLFYDAGDAGLETTVIGTHLSGHLARFYDRIESYHGEGVGLAPALRAYVEARNPGSIAINQSPTISMADGLTASLRQYLVDAIGDDFAGRLTSSEPMFIDYVSRRTPGELEIEKEAAHRTWNLLRRVFSNEVIKPGRTTLMDLHYWTEEERRRQGLEFNFPASFSIQRPGGVEIDDSEDPVIQPGDLIHVDYGVRLMGLVTDQQKMGYVLRSDETEPPTGLQDLFAQSVRMAEIIAAELKPGTEGRVARLRALERAEREGIGASVYSHVQGNWVHGVGAWAIQDWPERYGIHPREPVRASEFWSVEFSVSGDVPGWGPARMAREEDAWINPSTERLEFLVGPQTELWVIQSGVTF